MTPLTKAQAASMIADELHPKLSQILTGLEVIEHATGVRKAAFRPSGISLADLIADSRIHPQEKID